LSLPSVITIHIGYDDKNGDCSVVLAGTAALNYLPDDKVSRDYALKKDTVVVKLKAVEWTNQSQQGLKN
jgi:hypothetical protein